MAYYAYKNYFEDPEDLRLNEELAQGKLQMEWFRSIAEPVKVARRNPRRGLTYDDCNVGRYGYDALPELVRNNYSMAARGSVLVPGLPDLGYTINRKSDVWSDNVVALYEEAKTRRWVPAVDIDWDALGSLELVPEVRAAVCQLYTALEEMALVAMEHPSRWVSLINQEFLELKSFLCAQMIDEARHVEVFRKRALVGGGLKRASAPLEQALKEMLMAETYAQASLAINVLLAGAMLAIVVRAGRLSRADARLARLVGQDLARSIAYGVGHVRYHLAHQPAERELLQDYLDRTEHTLVGVLASREVLEPLIVLEARGIEPERVREASARMRAFLQHTVEETLARLAAAGLERRGRSRLPAFFAAA